MDSTSPEVKNRRHTFHLFSEKLWLDLLDNSILPEPGFYSASN